MFQIRWLLRNMSVSDRAFFACGLMLSALTSVMVLINPAITARLIDEVIVGHNTGPLISFLMIILAAHLLRMGLRYVMIIMIEHSTQNMIGRIRPHLFTTLQHQESRFFDTYRTGDLMTRFSGDLEWCRHFSAFSSYQTIECVTMFVSALAYLFTVNWLLTLLLLVVAPLLAVIARMCSKQLRPLFIMMRERLSSLNTAAQEKIAGNRVIKAFAREEYEKEDFGKKNAAYREVGLAVNKKWLTFYPIIETLANSMTMITLFVGGLFVINGNLTPGELTIFTGLAWALSTPMRNIGTLLQDFQRFITSANKVIEIYYARPLIADREDAVSHKNVCGEIEFRGVSLSHGGVKVIDDVSFRLERGQTLAVLGPTGAGKTTLVNLLTRFYDADEGEVLVDGCNVRHWRIKELRGAIGVATQEVFLFSDTVDGNIAFGNQSLTEEEVRDFARRTDAHGFISKMPDKYDTIVGERGVGLSGGQKQRLALARALAVRPAVLVLDDTTSAVDLETEKYIQEQLRTLPFECTKIIIAQRISSLRGADKIIVLENGRISESGTHEELLQNRGYYWETYALQNDIPVDSEVTA